MMDINRTTHYSVLGLSTSASLKEIKKAYKNLARELHPDKSKSVRSGELFKIVVDAYSVLSDSTEKLNYDKHLSDTGLLDKNSSTSLKEKNAKGNNDIASKDTFGSLKAFKKARKSKPYEKQPYGFGTYVDNLKSQQNKDDSIVDKSPSKNSTKKSGKKEMPVNFKTSSTPTFELNENSTSHKVSEGRNSIDEINPKPAKKMKPNPVPKKNQEVNDTPEKVRRVHPRSKYHYQKKSNRSTAYGDNVIDELGIELKNVNFQEPLNSNSNIIGNMEFTDLHIHDHINIANGLSNTVERTENTNHKRKARTHNTHNISLNELGSALPTTGEENFNFTDFKLNLMESPITKKLKLDKEMATKFGISTEFILQNDITSINSNPLMKIPPAFELSLNLNERDNLKINKENELDNFKEYLSNCNKIKSIIISNISNRLLDDLNCNLNELTENKKKLSAFIDKKSYDVELSNLLKVLAEREHDAFSKVIQIL